MKTVLSALVLAISASSTAYADPIYVIRPTISAKKVLPQSAFSAAPTTPPITNPPVPTPAPPRKVFTSAGYSAVLPNRTEEQDLNGNREFPTAYGSPQGVYYCMVVDDAGKTLSSKLRYAYYSGSQTNTPAIMLMPLEKGVFEIVLACGTSAANSTPREKFELTVK